MALFERSKAVVAEFTSRRTKAALLDAALDRKLLVAPVFDLSEVTALPQLASRDFWDRTEGGVVPGPFVKASRTPLQRGLSTPSIGQYTARLGEWSVPRPAAPEPSSAHHSNGS